MSLAEWNDYLLATLESFATRIPDIVHTGSPTYSFLQQAGLAQTARLGKSMVRPLLVRDAAEPQWWHYADEQTFTPVDVLEAARFKSYNVRTPIVVTEEELHENDGPQQVLDLWKLKAKATILTMRDRYNKALIWSRSAYNNSYGGVSTNLPESIHQLFGLSTNNTRLRPYGELSRAAAPTGLSTLWRTQGFHYSTGMGGTFSTRLRTLYFDCSRDGFAPGLLLCNQPGYEILGKYTVAMMTQFVNVTGGKAPTYEPGWDGLMFNRAQVRWDPDLNGQQWGSALSPGHAKGLILMINKEFMGLVEDDRWNWQMLPAEGPRGDSPQWMRKTVINHRMTMYHDNPRFCGVMTLSTVAGTT